MNYEPVRLSTAVKRIAHPRATAVAYIEFHDGYVYLIAPVFDSDLIELSRLQVHPGVYYNHILAKRIGFQAERLREWPKEIGLRADLVYVILS